MTPFRQQNPRNHIIIIIIITAEMLTSIRFFIVNNSVCWIIQPESPGIRGTQEGRIVMTPQSWKSEMRRRLRNMWPRFEESLTPLRLVFPAGAGMEAGNCDMFYINSAPREAERQAEHAQMKRTRVMACQLKRGPMSKPPPVFWLLTLTQSHYTG